MKKRFYREKYKMFLYYRDKKYQIGISKIKELGLWEEYIYFKTKKRAIPQTEFQLCFNFCKLNGIDYEIHN